MLRVNEIFYSIEGEGIRAGYPCTFIRLYGCNLQCSYCDSSYATSGEEFTNMTLDEITDKLEEIGCQRITVTGGEPLLQDESFELISHLSALGFEVNIETNGSVAIGNSLNVIYTIDMKTPSSGMSGRMDFGNLERARPHDVIKFVVGSQEDLEWASELLEKYPTKAQVFISPVFDKITPSEIATYIKENEPNLRLQLQIHKYIWNPEMRGV